ncbi:MAG: AAA-type ATPase lid domain-containing protein, partial [Eubacteriales bacterium]
MVPPLRERREDILALAFVFLMQFNKKYGLNKKYTSVVLEKFLRYSWPGNVRQLEN